MENGGKLSRTNVCVARASDVVSVSRCQLPQPLALPLPPFIYAEPAPPTPRQPATAATMTMKIKY